MDVLTGNTCLSFSFCQYFIRCVIVKWLPMKHFDDEGCGANLAESDVLAEVVTVNSYRFTIFTQLLE